MSHPPKGRRLTASQPDAIAVLSEAHHRADEAYWSGFKLGIVAGTGFTIGGAIIGALVVLFAMA